MDTRRKSQDEKRNTQAQSFIVDDPATVCIPDESGHCITCSDEGLLARVVALTPELALATVETNGRQLEVATDVLDEVNVGDTVLVHAGLAIARLEGDG